MEEPLLPGWWTEIIDGRGCTSLEMNKGIASQPQAEVPLPLTQVVKQLLMHKAPISKQSDYQAWWHEGTYLVEHWLVVFKTHLGTLMVQGSPGQRNSPTTIHQGGTNQDKGSEGSCIQGNIQARLRWPVNESSL